MSYYDVDAILTDAEKVPCQFELDVPHLGHLDNASSSGLKRGTSVSLPLWLAEMLALASSAAAAGGEDAANQHHRAPLTLNLPSCLSEQVLNALRADPRAVALRDQSLHFYGIGTRMLDLFDERELGAVLRRTFVVRAGDVGLHARTTAAAAAEHHGGGGGGGSHGHGHEFLRGLDEWERNLFRKSHEGVKGAQEWMENVKKM